jgi:hypothetical protein
MGNATGKITTKTELEYFQNAALRFEPLPRSKTGRSSKKALKALESLEALESLDEAVDTYNRWLGHFTHALLHISSCCNEVSEKDLNELKLHEIYLDKAFTVMNTELEKIDMPTITHASHIKKLKQMQQDLRFAQDEANTRAYASNAMKADAMKASTRRKTENIDGNL